MAHAPIRTAIVGIGRWGRNVARELSNQSEVVAYVSGGNESNQAWARANLPGAAGIALDDLAAKDDITAVAVATPISTHAAITRTLLEGGKHVLCEKPLAEDSRAAFELSSLARRQKLSLVTGYVFLYHPVYQELKQRTRGAITEVEFIWNKFGTFQDCIELNLLTHHLALGLDLLGKPTRTRILRRERGETACDILEVELSYPSARAISRINRIAKAREHRVTVRTTDRVYTWSDRLLFENDTKVFESGGQPLARQISNFIEAVREGSEPRTAGDLAGEVLALNELIATSENG